VECAKAERCFPVAHRLRCVLFLSRPKENNRGVNGVIDSVPGRLINARLSPIPSRKELLDGYGNGAEAPCSSCRYLGRTALTSVQQSSTVSSYEARNNL
jgi:hypothetical protein